MYEDEEACLSSHDHNTPVREMHNTDSKQRQKQISGTQINTGDSLLQLLLNLRKTQRRGCWNFAVNWYEYKVSDIGAEEYSGNFKLTRGD